MQSPKASEAGEQDLKKMDNDDYADKAGGAEAKSKGKSKKHKPKRKDRRDSLPAPRAPKGAARVGPKRELASVKSRNSKKVDTEKSLNH